MGEEKRLYFYLHVLRFNLEEIMMWSSTIKKNSVEQYIIFYLNL